MAWWMFPVLIAAGGGEADLSVLIATSKYYDVLQVMHLIIPLLIICAALVVLGSYLIIRSIIRIRHQDNLILQLKRKHIWISEYVD
jgi:hypothetical protein